MATARNPHPLYHQVADVLRREIELDFYGPGSVMPTEAALCREHGVSGMTVKRALAALREEGLITTKRGRPSIVRPRTSRQAVALHGGDRLTVRMPTGPERRALAIQVGVPLVEVRHASGTLDIFPADQVEVVVPQAAP